MARIHTAEFFDMRPFLEAERLPLDPTTNRPMIQQIMQRQASEVWRVRIEPVVQTEADSLLAWSLVRTGDIIRIPLIPYRTSKNAAASMLGGMDVIQRYVEAVPTAIRTHIVLGDPIQDLTPDGEDVFRFWLGFAAQIN